MCISKIIVLLLPKWEDRGSSAHNYTPLHLQMATSSSGVAGGLMSTQSMPIGGAAYAANSHNFIPSVTHAVPPHQANVFVEHSNGVFVPLSVHNQLEHNKEMEDAGRRRDGFGISSWNFHEDAKDFHLHIERLMQFAHRLRDMISGVACGFAMFKILDVYTVPSARNDKDVFLAAYEQSVEIVPKCFMFLSLILITLSLLPMGYDLAMQALAARASGQTALVVPPGGNPAQQRPGVMPSTSATMVLSTSGGPGSHQYGSTTDSTEPALRPRGPLAGLGHAAKVTYERLFQFLGWGSSRDSPVRHLLQVRFVAYVIVLAMTLMEIAVVDQRPKPLALVLSSTDVGIIHAAILVRAGVLLAAWLFSLADF